MRIHPFRFTAPASVPHRVVGYLLAASLLLAAACSDTGIVAPTPATPATLASIEDDRAVASGDVGGAPDSVTPFASTPTGGTTLDNGAIHTGQIALAGETDSWTFGATLGNRIVVSVGEISGSADFTPWVRLVAPNGTVVASDYGAAAAQVTASAPATGTYTVIVGTYDTGYDATGSYRVTRVTAPGTIVVSAGDQGGGVTNGAIHTGSIVTGDVDAWTFTAEQGDALVASVGEIAGSTDFTPWVRLIAPSGAVLASDYGARAAQVTASAPATGTYTVIVGTYDTGYDGTGDYRLTVVEVPGTLTVSAGDQGGVARSGAIHTGSIVTGDVDAWRFTAEQGDALVASVGEVSGSTDFTPWVRLIAPNGTILATNYGATAAQVTVNGPATGTYTVIVGTYDTGYDGTGDYRLTVVEAPDTVVVSSGDQGGAMNNGGVYTASIMTGDVDPWRFTATQGHTIAVSVGEVSGSSDFTPWVRLVAPNGTILATNYGARAAQVTATAPATGTYTVIVGTYDTGYDGTGSYRVTRVSAPGTIVVSAGDQGGGVTNGAIHTGSIVTGDVDAWTFTAEQGDALVASIGEVAGSTDFTPWVRLIAPNGTVLATNYGAGAAQVTASAPATGTYTVIVGTYDTGYDGTGDYRLTVVEVPGTLTVSAGDQGGAMTLGASHAGSIVTGDVDAWRFTAAQGQTIAVSIQEVAGSADFTPWIRLVAPNGAIIRSSYSATTTQFTAPAPSSGTYTVIVGTYDTSYDATGDYKLSASVTGAAAVVSGEAAMAPPIASTLPPTGNR